MNSRRWMRREFRRWTAGFFSATAFTKSPRFTTGNCFCGSGIWRGCGGRWPEYGWSLTRTLWNLRRAKWLRRSRLREQALYIQITRGVSPIRAHAFSGDEKPTVFIAAFPTKPPAETEAARKTGAACVVMEDFRWLRGDLKTTALLGAALLARGAKDAGAEEAVLIRDGLVTEGSSTNLLLAKDGELFTPRFDERVLRGITCNAVLEVAREMGIRAEERDIHRAELFGADELWLTSSTREITPITRLDGAEIADGKPGEMFRRVFAEFQKFKEQNCA